MNYILPRVIPERKSGSELFRYKSEELHFDLLSFWRWSTSDLLSNTIRGVLAEYIVARAIGLGESDQQNDWESYDLTSPSGVKIEVKSTAFIQSWAQKEFSRISFSYRARRAWDPETNVLSDTPKRHADVYVFCLLAHKDQDTIDPMDLAQWEFYVVNRKRLDRRKRSQDSITLNSLRKMCSPVSYHSLATEIDRVAAEIEESYA